MNFFKNIRSNLIIYTMYMLGVIFLGLGQVDIILINSLLIMLGVGVVFLIVMYFISIRKSSIKSELYYETVGKSKT